MHYYFQIWVFFFFVIVRKPLNGLKATIEPCWGPAGTSHQTDKARCHSFIYHKSLVMINTLAIIV